MRCCSFGTSTDKFIKDKFFFGLSTEEHVHCTTGTYSSKRSKNLLADPDLETNPMQPASSVAANCDIPVTYATLQENPAATATKLVTLQMFGYKLPKTEFKT